MLNKVIEIGRLVADVEIKQAGTNVVVKNTIAVQKNYKGKDGSYGSSFFNFEAWGPNANFINNYIKKGDLICIEGELDTNAYEKDGKKVTNTFIKVSNVYPLTQKNKESRKEEAHSPSEPNLLDVPASVNEFFAGTGVQVEQEVSIDTDNLPFY